MSYQYYHHPWEILFTHTHAFIIQDSNIFFKEFFDFEFVKKYDERIIVGYSVCFQHWRNRFNYWCPCEPYTWRADWKVSVVVYINRKTVIPGLKLAKSKAKSKAWRIDGQKMNFSDIIIRLALKGDGVRAIQAETDAWRVTVHKIKVNSDGWKVMVGKIDDKY